MAVLRWERALIRQKPDPTSITTSLTVTSVTQWSRPHRVMTVTMTMLNFSLWLSNQYHKAGPLRFVCGLAWSGVGTQHKWEYRDRNSTSVKCVAFKARVKPKSQQARGERGMLSVTPAGLIIIMARGPMTRQHQCENSLKSQSLNPREFRSTNAHFLLCFTLVSSVHPTLPLSLLPLTAGTATRHQQPSDWLSCCQIDQDHAPVALLTYTSCFNTTLV